MNAIPAFPLCWPPAMPRRVVREAGAFRTSIGGALKNVENSLKQFASDSGKAVSDIVLSSNVTLGEQRPTDPGVAAWFIWDGAQMCIPVDRYKTPEANLQAIHHILEARRVELRHGTLALVRATFEGFKALPAPAGYKTWRQILGFGSADIVDRESIEAKYRSLASKAHPDKGGSHEKMTELNRAKREGFKEVEV